MSTIIFYDDNLNTDIQNEFEKYVLLVLEVETILLDRSLTDNEIVLGLKKKFGFQQASQRNLQEEVFESFIKVARGGMK